MVQKLLVVTAGTVAAAVGQELLKRQQVHAHNQLRVTVRSIDTRLQRAYDPTDKDYDYFHLNITPDRLKLARDNPYENEHFTGFLYDGLTPQVQGNGAGGIRYNGAGALELNRDALRKWLHSAITSVILQEDGITNIALALVASAVGGIGSGTVERLRRLIIEASTTARLYRPAQFNTFILQPSASESTELQRANMLALYAEMAASRLTIEQTADAFDGRTILVGSDIPGYHLTLEQTIQSTATLIRSIYHPGELMAEYSERLADNHVLREFDELSGLPSHLSSATAVTIGAEDLNEQVIQRDAWRIIRSIISSSQDNASKAYTNRLWAKTQEFFTGTSLRDRYRNLLEQFESAIHLTCLEDGFEGYFGSPFSTKVQQLKAYWQNDIRILDEYAERGSFIDKESQRLADNLIGDFQKLRSDSILHDVSLTVLNAQYRQIRAWLEDMQRHAEQDGTRHSDEQLLDLHSQAQTEFNNLKVYRRDEIDGLVSTVQKYLRYRRKELAIDVILRLLKTIERHCSEFIQHFTAIEQSWTEQQIPDLLREMPVEDSSIINSTGNPLHIPAFRAHDDREKYIGQISLFGSSMQGRNAIRQKDIEEARRFCEWLQSRDELQTTLFQNDFQALLYSAILYTRDKIQPALNDLTLTGILLQQSTLLQKLLREAAEKLRPSITFQHQYAANCREAWHLSVAYYSPAQRRDLQDAIDRSFGRNKCTLIKSNNPHEIVAFYYVDGLPLSAITDIQGPCLEAFLARSQAWYRQRREERDITIPTTAQSLTAMPLYSGLDATLRVYQTGVIKRLASLFQPSDETATNNDILELGDDDLPQLRAEIAMATEWQKAAKLLLAVAHEQDISIETAQDALQVLHSASLRQDDDWEQARKSLWNLASAALRAPDGLLYEAFKSLGPAFEEIKQAIQPSAVITYARLKTDLSHEKAKIGQTITVSLEKTGAEAPDAVKLLIPEDAMECAFYIKAPGFVIKDEHMCCLQVKNGELYGADTFPLFHIIPVTNGTDGTLTVNVEAYPSVRAYPGGTGDESLPFKFTHPISVEPLDERPDPAELLDRGSIPAPYPDVILYVTFNTLLPHRYIQMYGICQALGFEFQPLGEEIALTEEDIAGIRARAAQTAAEASQASPTAVDASLRSFGSGLYDLLINDADNKDKRHKFFEKIMQRASRSHRLWSCLIISDEPALLPWEMVYSGSARAFFAERFIVAHWINHQGLPLVNEAPSGSVANFHYRQHAQELPRWQRILGKDVNKNDTESESHSEPDDLVQQGQFGLHVLRYIDPRQPDTITAIKSREAVTSEKSLDPAHEKLEKQCFDFTLQRPVVGFSFIDSQAIDEDVTLDYADTNIEKNWLIPFMHANASALVGPRWPTSLEADQMFFRIFHQKIDEGMQLGPAVYAARQQIRQVFLERADWLAYTYFGHPWCRLYEVQSSTGYTLFEAINPPEDSCFRVGGKYQFRASYRSEAPVSYKGRVFYAPPKLEGKGVSVTVMPLTGEPPQKLEMQEVSKGGNYHCFVSLTMPLHAATLPVVIAFHENNQEIQSLMLNLDVVEAR